MQLARWVGFVLCGETDLDHIAQVGLLTTPDRKRLREAHGFLLRLRNELHFHAGRSYDVLDKSEQLRIAELTAAREAVRIQERDRQLALARQQVINERQRAHDALEAVRARNVSC